MDDSPMLLRDQRAGSLEQTIRFLHRRRSAGKEFIKKDIDSLDYDRCENEIYMGNLRQQSFSVVFFTSIRSYFNFALLGVCTGCIGAFVNISIENLGDLKNHTLAKLIDKCEKGSCLYEIYFTWLVSMWIFIFIGTSMAVFVEPGVVGGGIAGVVAYLNGVDVPNCLTGSVVFFKTLCLICTMSSGMVAGKEGPMIHIGAAMGAVIVLIPGLCYCCVPFRNDAEMRDLVAAGVAGGVSAAFGAPVGGFLLSLEESVSFLSIRLMFKIFLCALFSVTTMNYIASVYNGFPGDIQRDSLLYLGKVEAEKTEYTIYEAPAFVVMGIIAGLVGSMYVFVQQTMHVLRRKYVVKKWMKMMEGVVVVFSTVTVHMLATYYLNDCSETDEAGINVKMNCKNGIKEISMYTLNTGEDCLRWLVQSPLDRISLRTSLALFLMYFGLGMYSLGISMAIGLFVPNLIIGAAWGRCVVILFNRIFPKNNWASAKKYTFLGAAAQLSGSLRLTFSITVITMEISGNIHLVLPLMLTLIVARWVGDLFTPAMFDAQILLTGMPVMSERPPPFSEEIPVSYIMSQPTVNLSPVISVNEALNTFKSYSHQGYPVVDSSNMLIGFVLASQIFLLIKSKTFLGKELNLDELNKLSNQLFRKKIDFKNLQVTGEDRSQRINLKIVMNPCPYAVQENMSFARAYNLFRQVGLRHLVIVNNTYKVVGIITRKDLAKYHVVQNGIARLPVI